MNKHSSFFPSPAPEHPINTTSQPKRLLQNNNNIKAPDGFAFCLNRILPAPRQGRNRSIHSQEMTKKSSSCAHPLHRIARNMFSSPSPSGLRGILERMVGDSSPYTDHLCICGTPSNIPHSPTLQLPPPPSPQKNGRQPIRQVTTHGTTHQLGIWTPALSVLIATAYLQLGIRLFDSC